jgi:DNA-binding MarR family transcriptional regulator
MPPQVELTTFDRKVLAYIYKYPGKTVKTIQDDFRSKHMVSNSLRYLARRGLITEVNFRMHPVCQVIA